MSDKESDFGKMEDVYFNQFGKHDNDYPVGLCELISYANCLNNNPLLRGERDSLSLRGFVKG
ncbi:MAG: hypothetical protein ABH811_01475 [archaeon]